MPLYPRHLSQTNLNARKRGSEHWKRQSTFEPLDEQTNQILINKIKQYEKENIMY